MNLSPHFHISEFEASETAARRGIDNEAPASVMNSLIYTARGLELARSLLGSVPVIVTSGYRCEALNRAVGGSKSSQHMQGRAADFIVPAFGRPLEVCKKIAASGIVFDQLIHEFGTPTGGGWIHMSFVPSGARKQLLTIDRHGTRTGLHPARA